MTKERTQTRRRRPMAWSVAMLEEMEGAGIDDRVEQARAMGVSLPQIDRIRKALRDAHRSRGARAPLRAAARASREERRPRISGMVQLGVRVPAAVIDRLRRHALRAGVSVALLTAVALDEWLTTHGTPGPGGISRKERETLDSA